MKIAIAGDPTLATGTHTISYFLQANGWVATQIHANPSTAMGKIAKRWATKQCVHFVPFETDHLALKQSDALLFFTDHPLGLSPLLMEGEALNIATTSVVVELISSNG